MLTDLAGKVLIKNYILLDTQTRTLDEKVRERYIYIYTEISAKHETDENSARYTFVYLFAEICRSLLYTDLPLLLIHRLIYRFPLRTLHYQ